MPGATAHTRIYLTGFMGTGKSTLGPLVASRLGWTFLDLDREIERTTGRSVAALFEERGETGFRKIERAVLEDVTARTHVVVALGGGAVLDAANRRRLLDTGILVCLTARLATLSERLVARAATRPLLQDERGVALVGGALTARIRRLLDARRTAYESAHVAVDTDERSIEETAERIVDEVGRLSAVAREDAS